MRSILLASAALIVSVGMASAQSSMAPAGPTTATPLSQSGSSGTQTTPPASNSGAGTMGPAAADSGTPTSKTITDSGTSGTTGAAPATNHQSALTPNTAPNMTPPSGSQTSSTTASTSAPSQHKSHWMAMSMPTNAGAGTYLHIANRAVMHGNAATAQEALSRAETVLLSRTIPQGGAMPDSSPAVSSIIDARKQVAAGDMSAASTSIKAAMQQAGSDGGMAPMGGMSSNATDMGGSPMATPASASPGDTARMHPAQGMGAPGATSDSAAAGGLSVPGVNDPNKAPSAQ